MCDLKHSKCYFHTKSLGFMCMKCRRNLSGILDVERGRDQLEWPRGPRRGSCRLEIRIMCSKSTRGAEAICRGHHQSKQLYRMSKSAVSN
jgi:hypothetical protein